ncbi:MAG: lipopolysaccharide biosynthesis protein [Bradyrhizobium sp.]|nr:MAG: lipopolysaccharide biosynthesis protein [Bradyrhizobium sp.]
MRSGGLLRNTLLYMPAQLFSPLLQFTVTVVWTHLFDPTVYGIVAFVVAAQELTGGLGLAWWSVYLLRFRQRYAEAERFAAMDARVVAGGALSQIVFALPTLALVGLAPSLALFAATAAYLASRAMLNHYGEVARATHRIGVYSLAQLSSPVLGSGLSIVAALALKPDAATALFAMALGQTIGVVLVSIGLRRPPRLGRFDRAIFREARDFALPLIFSGLFAWAAANGVRVLVGVGEGVAGVGLFSVGWGLGQRLAAMLASLCAVAAFPLAVDRLESGDRDGALRQVALNGALMFGLMAPAAVGVALLAGPFVRLAIAQQFQASTTVILPLAVLAGAIRALRVHTGDQTALLLRRTRAMTVFNFLDAAASLIGGGLGEYFGGEIGAAVGCLAGTCLGSAAAMGFVVSRLGFRIPLAAIGAIALATIIMGMAIALAPPASGALGLAVRIIAGAAIYAAAIVALAPPVRRFARAPFEFVARLRARDG